MPTYEYRCKSCSHQFDIIQSFADDPLTLCPSCGEESLKQVFGSVGISFKGSGFYKTDSRSAGSFGSTKDADRSDTGSSSSSDKKDTSTTSGASGSGSGSGAASSGSGGGTSGTPASSAGSSTAKSA